MMPLEKHQGDSESTILGDSSLLDNFYQLPLDDDCTFVHDVPEDIVSVMPSFSTWGMITPPYTSSSSEDESQFCLSPPPSDTDSTYIPGLLWDTTDDADLSSIWDTPPTTPPREFRMEPTAFSFDQPLFMDDPISPPLSTNTTPKKKSRNLSTSSTRPATAKRTVAPMEVKAGKRTASTNGSGNKNVKQTSNSNSTKSNARTNTSKSIAAQSVMASIGAATSSPGGLENPENKRRIHNVLERKRRNDLKLSYQALRCQLPALADNERAPTGHILIQAVEYISELKKEEATLAQKTAALREQIAAKRRRMSNLSVMPQAQHQMLPVGIRA